MLKHKQMVFSIVCLFFMGESFSQPSHAIEFEIQSVLETTEDIRLTDYPNFLKNMSSLESKQDLFTTNQNCLFQYLKNYKISYEGRFEIAKRNIKDVLSGCHDANVRIRLNSLLANISAISGDYNQAISRLDDTLSKLDETTDLQLKFHIYQAASIVYRLVDQYELSIKFSELMISENPPKKLLCKAEVNKALATFKINSIVLDDSEIKKTIDHCMQNKQIIYAKLLLLYWFAEKMQSSDSPIVYSQLLEQLYTYKDIIEGTQFKNIIGIKNSILAQLHEKLNNPEKAKFYANEAINGSISIGDTDQKIEALQVLINYHQNKGEYKEANQYLVEKNKSENNFYSDKQAKLMAFQTIKHKNLANTYKIKTLSQENQLLQLEKKVAEKSKKNQQLLNALFGITVLLFGAFAYRLIKQQRKFKRLSEYDYMTMIYNRKGIKEYMDYLLPYAKKKNEIVSYIIFDLDLFKRVNDVYGHVVGDWVIQRSIEVCKNLNNKKAILARLGGEEFSIVMRNSTIDEAIEFSDACRKAIYGIKTTEGTGHDFEVSASFGITTSELSGFDYDDMMKHADNALYYSKENGRNKITLYHPYC
ncbi:MAG: GGDEF domain-containing protein [Proteobacteria bacterium]|nr:GGDEF domain-containing protein [Pseudomonadota bacterium]